MTLVLGVSIIQTELFAYDVQQAVTPLRTINTSIHSSIQKHIKHRRKRETRSTHVNIMRIHTQKVTRRLSDKLRILRVTCLLYTSVYIFFLTRRLEQSIMHSGYEQVTRERESETERAKQRKRDSVQFSMSFYLCCAQLAYMYGRAKNMDMEGAITTLPLFD